MPLTDFQRGVLAITAVNRTPDSYIAGGTALHFAPESTRYSRDLDLFHDAEARVAEAFAADAEVLRGAGYELETVLSQPGFIRAVVSRDGDSTQIDWGHDSAWRFMPVVKDALGGYLLHPVDVATNKLLALAGRDEPRDFVDIMFILDTILPLGPLAWAAVAKDPGYNPLSLLEQLRRRGKPRPEEIGRLDLARPFDLEASARRWREALDEAERFVRQRPSEEAGSLYWSSTEERFVAPAPGVSLSDQGMQIHYGRMGGVLPRPTAQAFESEGDGHG
ncbi:MAG: nucleotidyl transferase AbiEii/AbiGii toxin family protein [Gemmatimonadota bacterium]